MSQHFEDQIEDLAREALSPEELREILDRLAIQETTEAHTVGAVCEVTGATPEIIGRMLADIRGVSFQQAFGRKLEQQAAELQSQRSRLETHDRRLADQQRQIQSIPRQQRPSSAWDEDPEVVEEMRQIAEERIQARKQAPLIYGFFALLFLLILPAMCSQRGIGGSPSPSATSGSYRYSTYRTAPDGMQIESRSDGTVWVKDPSTGKTHEATGSERAKYIAQIEP